MLASGLQGDAHGHGAEPALCNTDTNLTLVKWESWPGILSQQPMTNLTSKLFYEDSSGQKNARSCVCSVRQTDGHWMEMNDCE